MLVLQYHLFQPPNCNILQKPKVCYNFIRVKVNNNKIDTFMKMKLKKLDDQTNIIPNSMMMIRQLFHVRNVCKYRKIRITLSISSQLQGNILMDVN